jgi:hypothetical protein
MIRIALLAILSCLAHEDTVVAETGPVFSDAGPDAEARVDCVVVSFDNMEGWFDSNEEDGRRDNSFGERERDERVL